MIVRTPEIPISFFCGGDRLYGIVHRTNHVSRRGILMVAGGPQYRVGSHRQFVLLARAWAQQGIPVMRFDLRGMGDSEGRQVPPGESGADIASAIGAFTSNIKGLEEVIIWGLCDGATRALLYAPKDSRISGLVLVNPLINKRRRGARSAYSRVLGFINFVIPSLSDRMADNLKDFKKDVMLILSGKDIVASEFKMTVSASRRWQRLLCAEHVTRYDLPEANHVFSKQEWREQVSAWTIRWFLQRAFLPSPIEPQP